MAVDETLTAVASVVNNRPEPAPMVILDLPIPPGFAIEADDLTRLVNAGSIAKFQLRPGAGAAIVYLRDLKPGAPLTLRYRLRATMPVKLTVPPARAYEYYDPSRRGTSSAVRLTVDARSWIGPARAPRVSPGLCSSGPLGRGTGQVRLLRPEGPREHSPG